MPCYQQGIVNSKTSASTSKNLHKNAQNNKLLTGFMVDNIIYPATVHGALFNRKTHYFIFTFNAACTRILNNNYLAQVLILYI